jgi:hypothetical protein
MFGAAYQRGNAFASIRSLVSIPSFELIIKSTQANLLRHCARHELAETSQRCSDLS